jgi:hypothetical protein
LDDTFPCLLRARHSLKASFILSLPAPAGGFQRFSVAESPVMEPGLAAKHPDIKTYSGRGIDDRAATIRFDCKLLDVDWQLASDN